MRALQLSTTDDINVGQTIYALGNPEGLIGTFSRGILSAQERKLREVSYMQISAPISHGSSGGPVINLHGEVVAVVAGSIEAGQNLNFAIPTKYVRAMLPSVAKNQLKPRLNLFRRVDELVEGVQTLSLNLSSASTVATPK